MRRPQPNRKAAPGKWRDAAVAVLAGVVVLAASQLASNQPGSMAAQNATPPASIRIKLPDTVSNWDEFKTLYGPIPCRALRATLRNIASNDPEIRFPKNREVELFFDESLPIADKALSEEAQGRLQSLVQPNCP
ncbi:MAG: hypothetical protein MUC44_05310 [Beijerinckiaceae bacterium]|jgi:hypothetical protein|nr:hypothetical protein [Beijerinckiaceae bacterium]